MSDAFLRLSQHFEEKKFTQADLDKALKAAVAETEANAQQRENRTTIAMSALSASFLCVTAAMFYTQPEDKTLRVETDEAAQTLLADFTGDLPSLTVNPNLFKGRDGMLFTVAVGDIHDRGELLCATYRAHASGGIDGRATKESRIREACIPNPGVQPFAPAIQDME